MRGRLLQDARALLLWFCSRFCRSPLLLWLAMGRAERAEIIGAATLSNVPACVISLVAQFPIETKPSAAGTDGTKSHGLYEDGPSEPKR